MEKKTKIIIAGVGIGAVTTAGIGYYFMTKVVTKPITIGDINFKQVVATTGKLIVEFSRQDCEWCHKLASEIDAIKGNYALSGVRFANYSLDTDKTEAASLGVGSKLPAMVFYKDGKKVQTLIGYQTRDVLQSEIKKVYGV